MVSVLTVIDLFYVIIINVFCIEDFLKIFF